MGSAGKIIGWLVLGKNDWATEIGLLKNQNRQMIEIYNFKILIATWNYQITSR